MRWRSWGVGLPAAVFWTVAGERPRLGYVYPSHAAPWRSSLVPAKAIEEGGCSSMAMPPLATTASKIARCRCGGKLGTPHINFGVRRGRGPSGFSFSRLYSLHGGAIMTNLTRPDQASFRRTSKVGSCKISCWALPSRSKGSKQALLSFRTAAVTGWQRPAKTSSKIRQCAGPFVPALNWEFVRVRPLTGSGFVRCGLGGPWQDGASDIRTTRANLQFSAWHLPTPDIVRTPPCPGTIVSSRCSV